MDDTGMPADAAQDEGFWSKLWGFVKGVLPVVGEVASVVASLNPTEGRMEHVNGMGMASSIREDRKEYVPSSIQH